MLECPTCGDGVGLQTVLLEEPALRVDACPRCHGLWIPVHSYATWLERHEVSPAETAGDPVAELELRDGPFLRRCPTCSWILGRYRVGPQVPFTIDRCHQCRGIWLDAHEWEALKARRLHERLHLVFTAEWQRDIRQREADEREEAYRRRILGADGYARFTEFEAWLKEHPLRRVIMEILVESITPHVPRHYQEEGPGH